MALSLSSRVRIRQDVDMPILGVGTYKAPAGREVYDEVTMALDIGYRGIDTASMYGNEEDVGRAIRDSGLPRADVFVATKVWNDEQGYAGTLAAFERSIKRLGMEYVDLYLIHWPIEHRLADTWRAMTEILDRGAARAIGVCNFLPHHLDALMGMSDVLPAVDQVEHHPMLQQTDLRDRCTDLGITMQAWAPVMRGRASSVPELVEIAEQHGKTPSQVCLRWILQHGVTAIPKSVHRERLEENADVFDFELTHEEMARIDALDRNQRYGSHPDKSWAG